jgi:hypothetical protein
MNGRRLLLLLLILVMGGVVDAAWFLRQNVGVGASGCRVAGGRFRGPSYGFDAEDRRPLPADATVEVENAFGNVRVVQSATPELRVSLRKVVYRETEERARAFADRIRLVIEPGATLRVSTNREELERSEPYLGFETHLELALPKGASVIVRNEHGRVNVSDVAAADVSSSYDDVRVERIAGEAQVRARHANVTVGEVGGRLALSTRHGDLQLEDVPAGGTLEVQHGDIRALRVGALTVKAAHGAMTAQDVRGDLEVQGRHFEVDASDVGGRASIETSYDGIQVRRVGGEARLKADRGGISAVELDGPLFAEASFDDVVVEKVAGPIDVKVHHGGLSANDVMKGGRVVITGGEVSIQRFAGPLEIDAQRSKIDLQPAGPLTEPLLARTTFGDVSLRVPDGSRMALEAATSNGDLAVNVRGLAVTREGGQARGTLAGGTNAVRLFADHGNVEIESVLAAVTSDDADEDADEKESERRPAPREPE